MKLFRQHLNRSHPLLNSNSNNILYNLDSNAVGNNYNNIEPSSFASTLDYLSEINTTSDHHIDSYKILEDINVVDVSVRIENNDESLLLTQVS